MNIGQEITNHLEWMENIASILGTQELTAEELQAISQHDKCKLGHWLKSEASGKFKDLPEYEKLIESHQAFHELAGKLIMTLQLDKEAEAIEIETRFIETSQKVVDYLSVLQANAG